MQRLTWPKSFSDAPRTEIDEVRLRQRCRKWPPGMNAGAFKPRPKMLYFLLTKAFKRLNPDKQHHKLKKLQLRAQDCLSREEAQKIIKKANKAHRKLAEGDANG